MKAEEMRFRESILAAKLIEQQPDDLVQMLSNILVFEVPVPKAAVVAVCCHSSDLNTHIQQATNLGLLELNNFPSELQYRVPRILQPFLEPYLKPEDIYSKAAKALCQIWNVPETNSSEEQILEIHRLALQGKEAEIAVSAAMSISDEWVNRSKLIAGVNLCKKTLDLFKDYRILHRLASFETELGEIENAARHFEEAVELCPQSDEKELAKILDAFATLSERNGQINKASEFYQRSLEIHKNMNDPEGEAILSHDIACNYARQGQFEKALPLSTSL